MTRLRWKLPGRSAAEIAGLTLCLGLAGAALLRTYTCRGLSPALATQLKNYVIARRHLPAQTALNLVGSQIMPGSCMRQVTFAGPAGVRYSIAVSPDQKYAFGGSRFSDSAPSAQHPPPASSLPRPLPAPQPQPFAAGNLSPAQFASLLSGSPPTLGPSQAPVTVVEFSDFECPFCKRLADTLASQVLPAEDSKVRLVYRQFPLGDIHPWAEGAAETSVCVAQQSQAAFWRLHDYFFRQQSQISPPLLGPAISSYLGAEHALDPVRLRGCENSVLPRREVQADIQLGKRFGVRGTPTLFINGARLTGARNAAEIEAAIAAVSHGLRPQ